ncbi:SDR family NAD(P)-dependent oxidoreductase [Actinomadura rugatobispora]|uniref:SDR family NAD(P)-dependent oxidoreductase n=1 Tax=Actinomadura rugatobispora TaxID=1994 RepID=A0ABW0ZWG7_9ACTN|nr:SDR family oxidoreductase [Actinomadura rugatobispora]
MGELSGKVAAITGAGAGLGRRYALDFAREGAAVVVNDLNVTVEGDALGSDNAADVVAEIVAAGGHAVVNHADVSDPEGAASITRTAVESFGTIDILVNNAGVVIDAPVPRMSDAAFRKVIDVHLTGTFLVSREAFAHMADHGGGAIVNTTSRSGVRGKSTQANYSAAKGGIVAMTSTLAIEGDAFGIRANTISPRFASRAWGDGRVTSSGVLTPEMRQFYTSDAAARVVLYLASDRSAALSGRVLFASADAIQEMRWTGAETWVPGGNDWDLDDLEKAIADGHVLFTEDSNLGRPI